MSIVLFGPPGAGKGTQSAMLIDRGDMVHISTGDLFRRAMKENTPLGLEAKAYVDSGKLVPDSVTIGLVKEVLTSNPDKNFIFDGFPRNEVQAEALEELISDMGAKAIKHAVFLEVAEETLMGRLTGRRLCRGCGAVYHAQNKPPKAEGVCDACGGEIYQRKDDGADVISTRLQAYDDSTRPLKSYYESKGLFVPIDGVGKASEVFDRLKKYVQ